METLVQQLVQLKTDIETKERELNELYEKREEVQRILEQAASPKPKTSRKTRASRKRSHDGLTGAVWALLKSDRRPLTSSDLSRALCIIPTAAASVLSHLYDYHPKALQRTRVGRYFQYKYVGR